MVESVHPCVLIPTFDNPLTLEQVVVDSLRVHPDVIVVDDGSAAETVAILDRLTAEHDSLRVIRHEQNRGKGAALSTGFAAASELGFSHAISIDSDGQHLPEDIPRFVEAIERSPTTLFLGQRDLVAAGAPRGSRLGCLNSNFWTCVETGLRLPDTQTGFRAYPLASVMKLALATDRFDFEIEVLVRAAWTSVPIDSIPIGVRYFKGDQRVSHLRPFVDFMRIAHLNTRFVAQRICLPAPYLAVRSRREFHDQSWRQRFRATLSELFLKEPGSPGRIALSVGLGLFMGIAPFWGFQVALTLLCAHWFDLSKPIAVIASHVSFPLAVPAILYASLVLGRWIVRQDGSAAWESGRSLTSLPTGTDDFLPWVVGSFALAIAVATAGASVTYAVLAARERTRRAA